MKLCFVALVLNLMLFLNEIEASYPNNQDKSFAPTHQLSTVMNHAEFIRGKRPVPPRSSIDLTQTELAKVLSVKIPHELFSKDPLSSRTNKNRQLDSFDQSILPKAPIIPQAGEKANGFHASYKNPNNGNSNTIEHTRPERTSKGKAARHSGDQMGQFRTVPSRPITSPMYLEPYPNFINNQHLVRSGMSQQTTTNNGNSATGAYFPSYHDGFRHKSGTQEHAFQSQGHISNGITKSEHYWDGPPGFGPKH